MGWGEGFECRRQCEEAARDGDFSSCVTEHECTNNGGNWSPDTGRMVEVDGTHQHMGECYHP